MPMATAAKAAWVRLETPSLRNTAARCALHGEPPTDPSRSARSGISADAWSSRVGCIGPGALLLL
jgi:hypothetical protein